MCSVIYRGRENAGRSKKEKQPGSAEGGRDCYAGRGGHRGGGDRDAATGDPVRRIYGEGICGLYGPGGPGSCEETGQAEVGECAAGAAGEQVVDYSVEYRKQTGKDLETGEMVVQ